MSTTFFPCYENNLLTKKFYEINSGHVRLKHFGVYLHTLFNRLDHVIDINNICNYQHLGSKLDRFIIVQYIHLYTEMVKFFR
jgi:hypothetical protein